MSMAATSGQSGPTLRVTYVKSAIGYAHDQKATIRSLGFRRLNQTVELPDNPSVRGMCHKVRHLVRIEGDARAAGE
jgi:large subunit ribosomal protein L30